MTLWHGVSSWLRLPRSRTCRLYYLGRLARAKPCSPRQFIIHQREDISHSSRLTLRQSVTHCSRVSYLVTSAELLPAHNKPSKGSSSSQTKVRFSWMKSRK